VIQKLTSYIFRTKTTRTCKPEQSLQSNHPGIVKCSRQIKQGWGTPDSIQTSYLLRTSVLFFLLSQLQKQDLFLSVPCRDFVAVKKTVTITTIKPYKRNAYFFIPTDSTFQTENWFPEELWNMGFQGMRENVEI